MLLGEGKIPAMIYFVIGVALYTAGVAGFVKILAQGPAFWLGGPWWVVLAILGCGGLMLVAALFCWVGHSMYFYYDRQGYGWRVWRFF